MNHHQLVLLLQQAGWYPEECPRAYDFLCNRLLLPVVCRSPLNRDSAVWIVDTGASYDFIGNNETYVFDWSRSNIESYIAMRTANGNTCLDYVDRTPISRLREGLTPLELDDTPPLISVGRKCSTQ